MWAGRADTPSRPGSVQKLQGCARLPARLSWPDAHTRREMLRSLPTASPLTSLFAQKRVRMGSRQSTGPSCAISSGAPEGLSDGCKGAPAAPGAKLPIMGEESLMSQKGHGTCDKPVQSNLRWSCDAKLADRICW